MKGINKTIYIRQEDLPLWQQAEDAAWARRISLSQLLVLALEHCLQGPTGPCDLRSAS